MNSPGSKNPNNPVHKEDSRPNFEEIAKVKSVFNLFGKAYTSMKIYPPENPSIKYAFDVFAEKMKGYLDENETLLIAIEEFRFTYKGETVFQNEEKKISLPFLLFKDGMRELCFNKGLDAEELHELLVTIKEVSELPPENSDIVNSIWVKDFNHIRYFALEEFLVTNEGEGETDFEVDKTGFSQGKITLTPQDRGELEKRSDALGLSLSKAKEEKDTEDDPENTMVPSQIASTALDEHETPEIESMLAESRATSRMSEMVNLLFEILFLEERQDEFTATLNVLNQCFKEVVFKFNFSLASLIISRVRELKETASSQSEEKVKLLEKTLQKAKGRSSLIQLKELFLEGKIEDFDAFLQYLRVLGPDALPIVGDIWCQAKEPIIRLKASNFLLEIGSRDLDSLVALARDDRISLTREIIFLTGRIGEKRILPYLKRFVDHTDKDVKIETIQALRKVEDEAVNTILIKFLSDPEGEVRTLAAVGLRYFDEDDTAIDHVLQLAQKKEFLGRDKMEKRALLRFLATTQSAEVCAFLRSLLRKWRIFSTDKLNETRLCTVPALESMATPEAIRTLEEGTKIWNKTIRQACKLSLRKLISNGEFYKIFEQA